MLLTDNKSVSKVGYSAGFAPRAGGVYFFRRRALRLLEIREGIASILWVVLITVCFTYLFGMRAPRLHVLMVVAFTVVLTLVLYTIRALEYPFDGIVQVTPQAFELVLDKIEAGGR